MSTYSQRVVHGAQAYEKLADKLSPRSHTQLFQTHLYLEAALPPGKAPRLPLRLHNICRDVSALSLKAHHWHAALAEPRPGTGSSCPMPTCPHVPNWRGDSRHGLNEACVRSVRPPKVCMLLTTVILMEKPGCDRMLARPLMAPEPQRSMYPALHSTCRPYASLEKGLRPLCSEVLPAHNIMAGVQAWRKSKEWVTVSQLQKAIHRGLREAGLDVQMEYNEGLFSVDLALFLPPSHPGGDRRKARSTP